MPGHTLTSHHPPRRACNERRRGAASTRRARAHPPPPRALLDAHALFSWVSAASITGTALPLALRSPSATPIASCGGTAAPDGGPSADAHAARARALQVALTTISFLPYINFTAFGALAALDLASGRRASRPPTARVAAATALYATPLVLLAATGDPHAAVASTFLCAAHFTAENVLRGAEAADAAAAAAPADDDALLAAAADVASLADAAALKRWDARLALTRARRDALVALATRAGIRVKAAATRATLAAALAEAAGLDDDAMPGLPPPAPWLVDELAGVGGAEVEAAAQRAARRRKRSKSEE